MRLFSCGGVNSQNAPSELVVPSSCKLRGYLQNIDAQVQLLSLLRSVQIRRINWRIFFVINGSTECWKTAKAKPLLASTRLCTPTRSIVIAAFPRLLYLATV